MLRVYLRFLKVQGLLSLLIGLVIVSCLGCGGSKNPDPDPFDPPVAPVGTMGRIITAVSLAREDVQAAIDQAEDGDTVLLPAGTVTWTSQNNIPAVSLDKKGITLLGAGIGKTIINTIIGTGYGNGTLRIVGVLGKPFRISGFSFPSGIIGISGNAMGWRIDNCEFTNDSGMTSIGTNGFTRGVVDNCTFANCRIVVREDSYGVAAWKRPLRLGTADAVYIEDSRFPRTVFGNSVDANRGGQYVFRHNTVINSSCEAHSLQNAFPDLGKFERATRSYEIYNNTFTSEDNGATHGNWVAIFVRGGTGVIFGNKVENVSGDAYNSFGVIDNLRSFTTRAAPLLKADGSNPLDGNEETNGYPALDQIGRSTDAGPGENYHPQAHEPLHVWDNIIDGNPGRIIVHNTSIEGSLVAEHIKEGRDFFHERHPSYSPYIHPVATGTALILTWPTSDSQTLETGQQYNITWRLEEDIVVGDVTLEFYKGNEKVGESIAVVNAANGSCAWTVPDTLVAGDDYRIRIFQGAIGSVSRAFAIMNS